MTFDEVWRSLSGMNGRRFLTLDQRKPFVLEDVTPSTLTIRVEATGYPRAIPRAHFEEAWQRLSTNGRLARTEIHREISRFNPAYVASLLAHVPGVTHTSSPIVLVLGGSAAIAQRPELITPEVEPDPDEETEATEIETSIADRLADRGRELGYDARKEWKTELGSRIDVVWAIQAPPEFPTRGGALLPIVGFEIETSARSRKHVKGDIFNLSDLSPALGVIVLCQGPNDGRPEIESLRATAQRCIARLGLRIDVWSDEDVARVSPPRG